MNKDFLKHAIKNPASAELFMCIYYCFYLAQAVRFLLLPLGNFSARE